MSAAPSLGLSLIQEIAAQNMITALPRLDPMGHPTGYFYFKWKPNATEQLEAVVHKWFQTHGAYGIAPGQVPLEMTVPSDLPNLDEPAK